MALRVSAALILILVLAVPPIQGGAAAKEQTVCFTLPARENHPIVGCDRDSTWVSPEAHDQEWLRIKMWRFGRTDTLHMSVGVDGMESDTDSLCIVFDIIPGTMGVREYAVVDTAGNVSCVASEVFAVSLDP